jgi:glycosyltransferase involved in cell wall biosynthesis
VTVLFLTHAFPRTADDVAGSFILRLAVALRGEGITAVVLAPHAPGLAEQSTIQGIAVRRFRYAPEQMETLAYTGTMAEQVRGSWGARVALGGMIASAVNAGARAGKRERPQLIHAHWWFPNGLAAVAVSLLRRLPLVTTLHGSDVRLAYKVPGARALYAQVASRSKVVTAVSSWLATQAALLAPRSPEPRIAQMPVDVSLFSPGASRAPGRLLFVGRLTEQKGVDLLLRALAKLPPRISLDVIGNGPDEDRLRVLATSLNLAERVRWHHAMPQAALVEFYRTATAVVVPSIDEGLGLVAVEAQLCEAPVVAFDSGGLRDVVIHGETGLLAPEVTAEGLVRALSELLERSDHGAAFGMAGRLRALERFSPDVVARRYTAIYREAIDHSNDR